MSLTRILIGFFAVLFVFSSAVYSQNKENIPEIMEGTCSFEYCTYTNWIALNNINVYQNPQDTTLVFVITKGEEFKAETGNVYITEPGLVIAKKSFVISDISPKWEVERNDTLYILAYEGEGYYNVFFQGNKSSVSDHSWYNRRINEPDETELAKQVRTVKTEWWVKIVDAKNRKGWIFMEQAQVNGHDACGQLIGKSQPANAIKKDFIKQIVFSHLR